MPSPRTLHARSLSSRRRADEGCVFEDLEGRQLLTITIVTPVADLSLNRGAPAGVVSLANRYTDPSVSNVVRFQTTSGALDIALFGGAAPNTVANFLAYVNSGAYNNSIFHRETTVAADGIAVLQGGGFQRPVGVYDVFPPSVSATPQAIPTNPAIALENPTGNTRGSIAMARTNNINSATSQFFFNVVNNLTLNDSTPNIPDSGYAVFGNLLPSSLQVLDALVAYQNSDFSQDFGASFAGLPLMTPPNGQGFVPLPINPSAYLTITNASVLSGIYGQISVTSANPTLVGASLNGGNLILTPGTVLGTTTITVRITSFDGTFVEDAFDVTVTNPPPAIGGIQGQSNIAVGHSMLVSAFGVRDMDAGGGGGIGSVAFYYDTNDDGTLDGADELLGADTSSTGGWSFRVATTSMSAGANRIFARVTDTENSTAVTSLVVTLRAAVPGGTITPDPTTVNPGDNVDIGIGGLPDSTGIRRVSIFLDTDGNGILNPLTDRLIGHATYSNAGTNWVFTVAGEDLSTGLNRIFARTTDNYGNLGGITSSIINVN